tara:strand:- start:547 stop:1041 length:495 start_codon:yes stop_codon:yes gene_type:complete
MVKERTLFSLSFVMNCAAEDAFFYLGHTFENASMWMHGCRRVIAKSGYERFGMWQGKRYFRSMALPFFIGSTTKEEWVHHIEENKRFVIRTDFPTVQPHWDYNFKALDNGRCEFRYRVYTTNHSLYARFLQFFFMALAKPRLNYSHPRMVELLSSGIVRSQLPA